MSISDLRRFKAEIFKALANPQRIAVLDSLRSGELTVGEMAAILGVEQAALSQQLSILRAKSIVKYRKQGNFVHYSAADPTIFAILDAAADLFQNHVIDLQGLVAGPQADPAKN